MIWVAGSTDFKERLLSLRQRLPDREFVVPDCGAPGNPDIFFVEVDQHLDKGWTDCIERALNSGTFVGFGRAEGIPPWAKDLRLQLNPPLPETKWEGACLSHINGDAAPASNTSGLIFVIKELQKQLGELFPDQENVDANAYSFVVSVKDCLERVAMGNGLLPPPPPHCEFSEQLKTAVTMIWCRHRFFSMAESAHKSAPRLAPPKFPMPVAGHPLLLKSALIFMLGHTWTSDFTWNQFQSAIKVSRPSKKSKRVTLRIGKPIPDPSKLSIYCAELARLLYDQNAIINVKNDGISFGFDLLEAP